MIKNIIFDMGGVLIDWNPHKLIQEVGIDDKDHDKVFIELFKKDEWVALDAGTMTYQQAIDSINSRLEAHLHDKVASIITNWWNIYFKSIDGMADLIGKLKENGYKIYLLSNASLGQKDYFHRIEGSKHFDGRVTSAEINLLKPEIAIYKYICDKYDLKPEESFFVDDSATNVYYAKRFGLKSCVYIDIEDFVKQMRKEGIKI